MATRKKSGVRVRRRYVRFGNPALGRYGGVVYTIDEVEGSIDNEECMDKEGGASWDDDDDYDDDSHEEDDDSTSNDEEEEEKEKSSLGEKCGRLVAMVEVPPEQVPEGVLTLARAHRPKIRHVRILTSSSGSGNFASTTPPSHRDETPAAAAAASSLQTTFVTNNNSKPISSASTPSSAAMESAAEIMAADESAAADALRRNREKRLLIAKTLQEQERLRRQSSMRSMTYLVLFELSTRDAADVFVRDLHGKPYTSLQDDVTCRAYRVVRLKGDAGVSLMSPFFASSTDHAHGTGNAQTRLLPPPSQPTTTTTTTTTANLAGLNPHPPNHHSSEIQNCAVCLELLDLDDPKSSILTTVCNHSFHLNCLLRWQDSPCPVCRYDHSGLNEALSQCHACGTTENNYVCLICGVVSCQTFATTTTTTTTSAATHDDRPVRHDGHARHHYDTTLHAYALEIESQHVWDFAGDGFVHRLIRNVDDGKLVEITDPTNTTSQQRSLSPGLSDAQEEELVHTKLERFASQYYTLLKSQLEQQRIYYEAKLEQIRRHHRGSDEGEERNRGADLIAALKQDRNQLEQRCMTLRRKYQKVKKDVEFLKHMNESLEANKAPMERQIVEARKEREEARSMIRKCLPPLEEKVKMLMMQLEGGGDFVPDGGGNGRKKQGMVVRSCEDDRKPAARRR